MSALQVAAWSAAVIGVTLAVAVAIRGRTLLRPRLVLAFGLVNEAVLPRSERRKPRYSTVFGMNCHGLSHILVPCAYRLENRSPLPITQIAVRLQYPTECVVDDTAVIDSVREVATFIGKTVMTGRTLLRLGETTQVEFTLDILRPRETGIFVEIIRLPIGRVAGWDTSAPIQERYRVVKRFRSAALIGVWVGAANAPAIARPYNVFACESSAPTELHESFKEIVRASWDGRRPLPGLYFSRPGFRVSHGARTLADRQLAEITFVDNYTVDRAVLNPEILTTADTEVGH